MADEGREDDRRSSRLAFARLEAEFNLFTAHDSNLQMLQRSIVAGTSAERHNRLWRMGKYSVSDGHVLGRLGFTNSDTPTEVWDETETDFVGSAFASGYTSPFAIRISDFLVSFPVAQSAN